jgi:dTDP-4-dehydrorhamnose reductase
MSPNKILVTGANGQLGKEFRTLEAQYPISNLFSPHSDLPIEDSTAVEKFFQLHHPFFVLTVPHTAVDKAESEKEIAHSINAEAVGIPQLLARMPTLNLFISQRTMYLMAILLFHIRKTITGPINY